MLHIVFLNGYKNKFYKIQKSGLKLLMKGLITKAMKYLNMTLSYKNLLKKIQTLNIYSSWEILTLDKITEILFFSSERMVANQVWSGQWNVLHERLLL